MIAPTVTFTNASVREFQSALRQYIASTKRALPDIINQRALNVAGNAFDILPPSSGIGVDVKRREISKYMNEPLAQYVKFREKDRDVYKVKKFNVGKIGSSVERKFVKTLKAGFHQAKAKSRQLQRRHLIVQARQRKEGKKGLYGPAMRKAAGTLSRASTAGVGFLKSAFLPAIYRLNPVARKPFPHRKTKNIKRWSASGSWGSAQPARVDIKSAATFSVNVRIGKRSEHTSPRVRMMLDGAVAMAMAQEAEEMRRHVQQKLQSEANKIMHPAVRKS